MEELVPPSHHVAALVDGHVPEALMELVVGILLANLLESFP